LAEIHQALRFPAATLAVALIVRRAIDFGINRIVVVDAFLSST